MSIDTSEGHPAMDYKQHESTYKGFVRLFFWGTVACLLLLIFMAATLV